MPPFFVEAFLLIGLVPAASEQQPELLELQVQLEPLQRLELGWQRLELKQQLPELGWQRHP